MSTNTSIEWTDATWNPIRGCTRVTALRRRMIVDAVKRNGGHQGKAANELGIHRNTLARMMGGQR